MAQSDVTAAVHDDKFYLDDGDFVICVEDTLFKVILDQVVLRLYLLHDPQGAQIRAQQRLVHIPEYL